MRPELEEAGALLKSFTPFGFFRCRSPAARSFRPHLPHPEFIRLVGAGEVKVVASPSNPTGGEQVAAIELLSLADAVERLRSFGREDLAELYLLAAQLS